MKFHLFGVTVRFQYSFFLVLSLFLLWDKTGWAGMSLLSMALHELAHLFMMLLLGIRIQTLTFCPFGVNIEKSPSLAAGYLRESLVYLAGPLCNLALAFGSYFMGWEVFSAINLAIALLQMLPIQPLDGGQILSCVAGKLLSPDQATTGTALVTLLLLTPLTVAALLLFLQKGNFTLLVLLAALLLKRPHS